MNTAQLSDIWEIQMMKARYFRYADTGQWEAFRDLFTEDLVFYVDDPSLVQSLAGEPAFTGPDSLVAYFKSTDPNRLSVHHGHMPEIEFVDDDTANGVWAVFAWAEYPTRSIGHETYGHYFERYVRCADGVWRIAYMRLTPIRHSTITLTARG